MAGVSLPWLSTLLALVSGRPPLFGAGEYVGSGGVYTGLFDSSLASYNLPASGYSLSYSYLDSPAYTKQTNGNGYGQLSYPSLQDGSYQQGIKNKFGYSQTFSSFPEYSSMPSSNAGFNQFYYSQFPWGGMNEPQQQARYGPLQPYYTVPGYSGYTPQKRQGRSFGNSASYRPQEVSYTPSLGRYLGSSTASIRDGMVISSSEAGSNSGSYSNGMVISSSGPGSNSGSYSNGMVISSSGPGSSSSRYSDGIIISSSEHGSSSSSNSDGIVISSSGPGSSSSSHNNDMVISSSYSDGMVISSSGPGTSSSSHSDGMVISSSHSDGMVTSSSGPENSRAVVQQLQDEQEKEEGEEGVDPAIAPAWQGKVGSDYVTKCHNGELLPFRAKCNKVPECWKGEDEVGCDWFKSSPVPTIHTTNRFDTTISENEIVLVEFFAPWCPACITFLPILNQLQENTQSLGLPVIKVNTDEDEELRLRYEVNTYPRVILFNKNWDQPRVYDKKRGMTLAKIESWIKTQLSLGD